MLKSYPILLIFFLLLTSCGKTVYVDAHHVVDNEYDSEFPNVPTSQYLEEISNSVKRVNIVVNYIMYELSFEQRITRQNLDKDKIKEIATNETFINSPASGTASIIYNNNQRIALLSCAHIFNYPDTIIINHLDNLGNATPYVESVYYKTEQKITVLGLAEITGFEVLASDADKDVAVIGKTYRSTKMINYYSFRYPKGYARELKPGVFVFLFGYPRGIQIVSKAIVGQANKGSDYGFIIDAAVHNGISGGPVFALRDGAPNFEMVGMVYAIAGEMLQFLGPKDTQAYNAYEKEKYVGDIYLKSTQQIVYGVTYAVSMESIEEFFTDNHDLLMSKGYNSKQFLNQKSSFLKDLK